MLGALLGLVFGAAITASDAAAQRRRWQQVQDNAHIEEVILRNFGYPEIGLTSTMLKMYKNPATGLIEPNQYGYEWQGKWYDLHQAESLKASHERHRSLHSTNPTIYRF